MNRKSWQRMALSIFGIFCTMLIWHIAIGRLEGIKPEAIASFTTLTVNTQYVIGIIVIFMVTGKMVTDWRTGTLSQVITQSDHIIQDITERTPAPKHFDDDTIA